VRAVSGVLPSAIASSVAKLELVVPVDNASEASLVNNLTVQGARHLLDVVSLLNENRQLTDFSITDMREKTKYADLSQVQGQHLARRALEICASGGHNLLMSGPPGTGKSMLANRLPGILPPMSGAEALETASIYSISNQGFELKNWQIRPFRAPHHTLSSVALAGGGSKPKPGEISLAHNGVLFLDELPEYTRNTLEVLREPMESGKIQISRANDSQMFPASFQLIAAMNPCPCGYLGDKQHVCKCTQNQIKNYHNRLSLPFLDRIDMQIHMPRISSIELTKTTENEKSSKVADRVSVAYQIQNARQSCQNARLDNTQVKKFCHLDSPSQQLLNQATDVMQLSMRAYYRVLKISRTIADLQNEEIIRQSHIAEAINFRQQQLTH
jgi:magnesium chelatase family protein